VQNIFWLVRVTTQSDWSESKDNKLEWKVEIGKLLVSTLALVDPPCEKRKRGLLGSSVGCLKGQSNEIFYLQFFTDGLLLSPLLGI
jgi:hypothetical protein